MAKQDDVEIAQFSGETLAWMGTILLAAAVASFLSASILVHLGLGFAIYLLLRRTEAVGQAEIPLVSALAAVAIPLLVHAVRHPDGLLFDAPDLMILTVLAAWVVRGRSRVAALLVLVYEALTLVLNARLFFTAHIPAGLQGEVAATMVLRLFIMILAAVRLGRSSRPQQEDLAAAFE